MASPAAATIHNVSDKLLTLILLRLDSSASLVRAAATCKRWRAIIAGSADFLRLSRALHRPAIAGHYHLDKHPADFVPAAPPPAVDFLPDGRRFSSLDFLPADNRGWEVADCHGGLLLLRQPEPVVFPDLVVCDPVARRYQGITHPQVRAGYNFADASLLGGQDGAVSMSSYRILYRFFTGPFRACVFTAGEPGGDWRGLDVLGSGDLDHFTLAHVAGRLDDGALCMGLMQSAAAILLDNSTLEFSRIDLPTKIVVVPSHPEDDDEEACYSNFRVVHSAHTDLRKATTRIVHVRGQELEVFRRHTGDGDNGSCKWVLEHSVARLSEACRGLPGYPANKRYDWIVEVVANGAGFVVLSVMDCGRRWLFSVDVETMEMTTVPDRTFGSATCPYTMPWPPVFVECLGNKGRRRWR